VTAPNSAPDSADRTPVVQPERAPTGSAGLDDILGGG
jgi:hypothetical protein